VVRQRSAAAAFAIVTLVVLGSSPALAQTAPNVVPWADVMSYATAAVAPSISVATALRSSEPRCQLLRLGVSEAIGNGLTLTLKHLVNSPRPCSGCAADGMPSGHTMNSTIGFSSHWQVGLAFALGTAELRTGAHRHTPMQVAAGAAIGAFAEWAGRAWVHCA
jgi:membrane-associated phospholipid phosphatase